MADSNHDPTAELKRRREDTRVPADVKEEVLAQLPSPEERERLFRELQEQGGLSFEDFLTSLGLEVKPEP
jgi:3-hydroxyisobutyrate dehydrogenase-like beta-hydroxyacid dehydrogenase